MHDKERHYQRSCFQSGVFTGTGQTGTCEVNSLPLAINGDDTKENMLPACRSCNKYKNTLDVEGFREYLSGIPKRVRRDDIAFQVGERYGLLQENKVPVVFYFEKVRENEKV